MGLAADLMKQIGPAVIREKLEARTERTSTCWLYKGPLDDRGRGLLWIGRRRPVTAHRAAYFVYKGEIPAGLCVCHACDVPSCVNPDHLWLGTQQDNLADMRNKNRDKPPPNKRQLTPDDIRQIRERVARGETQRSVATDLGIGRSTVSAIVTRHAWAWLT
jgi:hypothetical protein